MHQLKYWVLLCPYICESSSCFQIIMSVVSTVEFYFGLKSDLTLPSLAFVTSEMF